MLTPMTSLVWLVCLFALVAAVGCVDCERYEQVRSCADLGCPVAPSGTPDVWTPCTGNQCWCWAIDGVSERCVRGQ